MKVVTLAEARLAQLERYFTGKPCKHGHVSERYTRTQICIACCHAFNKERDFVRLAATSREWKFRNSDAVRAYKQSNRAKDAEQQRARYWAEVGRFRGEGRYRAGLRIARKKRACPSWAELKAIKEVYANCPSGMQVDHIIPLAGRNVSGLHVPANLQYLPAQDNRKKGNRYVA